MSISRCDELHGIRVDGGFDGIQLLGQKKPNYKKEYPIDREGDFSVWKYTTLYLPI